MAPIWCMGVGHPTACLSTPDECIARYIEQRAEHTCAAAYNMQVPRGRPIDIPYELTVTRQLAGPAVATLSFTVTCPGTNFATASVSEAGSDKELASTVVNNGRADFNNVPWTKVPSSPTVTSQGSIVATCFPPPQQQLVPNQPGTPTPGTRGEPKEVVFQPANTREVRGTASLTDVIKWPTWNDYFQGTWLNTPPSIAVTSGNFPAPGTVVTDSEIFRYTYTISNTILCFTGAQVRCGAGWPAPAAIAL